MRFTKTIASASVAAVLGVAGISVAGATANAGSASQPAATAAASTGASASTGARGGAQEPAARRAVRRRHLRRAAKLAAATIGITPAQLRQGLRAGKTIAAIATENYVEPQAVITALEQAAGARIAAALSAHKITAERAAKLTTRYERVIPKLVNNWHLSPAKTATG